MAAVDPGAGRVEVWREESGRREGPPLPATLARRYYPVATSAAAVQFPYSNRPRLTRGEDRDQRSSVPVRDHQPELAAERQSFYQDLERFSMARSGPCSATP